MSAKLRKMQSRIELLLSQKYIPIEVSESIAEEIASLMLNEDTGAWTYQYENSTIKPL